MTFSKKALDDIDRSFKGGTVIRDRPVSVGKPNAGSDRDSLGECLKIANVLKMRLERIHERGKMRSMELESASILVRGLIGVLKRI